MAQRLLLLFFLCVLAFYPGTAQQVKFYPALDTINSNYNIHLIGSIGEKLILVKTNNRNAELIAWTESAKDPVRKTIALPQLSRLATLSYFTANTNAIIISQYQVDKIVYTGIMAFDSTLMPTRPFTALDSTRREERFEYNPYRLLVSNDEQRAVLYRINASESRDSISIEYFDISDYGTDFRKNTVMIHYNQSKSQLMPVFLSEQGNLFLGVYPKETNYSTNNKLTCYQLLRTGHPVYTKTEIDYQKILPVQPAFVVNGDSAILLISSLYKSDSHQLNPDGIATVRISLTNSALPDNIVASAFSTGLSQNFYVGYKNSRRSKKLTASELWLSYATCIGNNNISVFLENNSFRGEYLGQNFTKSSPTITSVPAPQDNRTSSQGFDQMRYDIARSGQDRGQFDRSQFDSYLRNDKFNVPQASSVGSSPDELRAGVMIQDQYILSNKNNLLNGKDPDLRLRYDYSILPLSSIRFPVPGGYIAIRYGDKLYGQFIFEFLSVNELPIGTVVQYPEAVQLFHANEISRKGNRIYTLYFHPHSWQIGIAKISW